MDLAINVFTNRGVPYYRYKGNAVPRKGEWLRTPIDSLVKVKKIVHDTNNGCVDVHVSGI